MTLLSRIAALPLLVVAVTAFSQDGKAPKSAPVRSYDREGIQIDALGACTIGVDDVQCWNMDGALDKGLGDRVIRDFLSNPNVEISLKYGRKNRFLIVNQHNQRGGVQFQLLNGNYVSTQQGRSDGTGPTLYWIRVDADPEMKSTAVQAQISGLKGPPPVKLGIQQGATATMDGVRVTMGPIKAEKKKTPDPDPNRNQYQPIPYGKVWSVILGLDNQATSLQCGYEMLGEDGKPIEYVDKQGQPVSAAIYLSEQPTPPAPGYYPYYYPNSTPPDPKAKYLRAVISPYGPAVNGAFTLQMNVDPRYVANLRLTQVRSETVVLGDFPLDPKG